MQRRVGSKHARGQAIEEHGVLVAEPEVLQRDVHVGEGHRERARRGAAVAILSRQRQRRGAVRRDAGGERRRARRRPARAGCRSRSAPIGSSTAPVVPDSARPSSAIGLAWRASAADEARAVGLPLDGAAEPRPSTPSTWKPTTGDSSAARGRRLKSSPALCGIELGLDEQLAERRVREVVLGRAERRSRRSW